MGIIFTVITLVLLFKLTGVLLKLCGKILGGMFSLLGYILLAAVAVTGFGLAIVFVPVIIVVGVFSLIAACGRLI